jgi:hypothetical protein
MIELKLIMFDCGRETECCDTYESVLLPYSLVRQIAILLTDCGDDLEEQTKHK